MDSLKLSFFYTHQLKRAMASKATLFPLYTMSVPTYHSQISPFLSNAWLTDTDREMVESGNDMETMYLFTTDYKYSMTKNELVRRTTKSGVWNRKVE